MSLCRDVLRSRHLWKWEKGIFASLCGESSEEGEEELGTLTRRTLSTTLTHFMTNS